MRNNNLKKKKYSIIYQTFIYNQALKQNIKFLNLPVKPIKVLLVKIPGLGSRASAATKPQI